MLENEHLHELDCHAQNSAQVFSLYPLWKSSDGKICGYFSHVLGVNLNQVGKNRTIWGSILIPVSVSSVKKTFAARLCDVLT